MSRFARSRHGLPGRDIARRYTGWPEIKFAYQNAGLPVVFSDGAICLLLAIRRVAHSYGDEIDSSDLPGTQPPTAEVGSGV